MACFDFVCFKKALTCKKKTEYRFIFAKILLCEEKQTIKLKENFDFYVENYVLNLKIDHVKEIIFFKELHDSFQRSMYSFY